MFSDWEPQALHSANVLERRIGKSLGFFLHSDATLSDSQIGPREQPTSGRHAILNWLIYAEFIENG